MSHSVSGFSKLTKDEKIDWISRTYFKDPQQASALIRSYWNSNPKLQQLHDEFIENTITNFYLPLGVAPNFLINGNYYTIPMAVEESSVVAAAAKSAKFWATRGGFRAEVVGTEKIGQVHLNYYGSAASIEKFFDRIRPTLLADTEPITKNMRARGGGITSIELRDRTDALEHYYQIHATFETRDSMGANFINTVLEQIAKTVGREAADCSELDGELEVVMSILSNYVTNCIVRAEVSCPVAELAEKHIHDPEDFARRFVRAVQIAESEPYRAVTHNKGIMNGVDAVVIATGNDFRAVEAAAHAYASRNGVYGSLSHAEVRDGIFRFWIDLPLALGTVGGLTSLHPLVKLAHEMLEKPSAQQLMQIVAVAGLAQNFAALRSLTTTGIQEGHMKMHLNNIINQFDATKDERHAIREHFTSRPVSHAAVVDYIESLRR